MATAAGRLKISNGLSDRLVHQWRSEEQSIMIGTRTAETDNPFLTVRHHAGKNPLRIVIDKNLRLSPSLNIFNGEAPTIIMNNLKNEIRGSNEFLKISFDDLPAESLKALHERSVQSLLIEGGKNLLEQFIEADLWDEIRVITSPGKISDGLKAPDIIPDAAETLHLDGDKISVYYNNSIKASP